MKESFDNKINGTWVGQLTYDNENEDNILHFEMTISVRKGIITGKCQDMGESKDIQEPAEINGFVENNIVSFIKKYKHYYEIDENDNLREVPGKAPVDINYTGKYIEEQKRIEGDWDIITQSHQYGYGSFEEVITGKWMMVKKSEDR